MQIRNNTLIFASCRRVLHILVWRILKSPPRAADDDGARTRDLRQHTRALITSQTPQVECAVHQFRRPGVKTYLVGKGGWMGRGVSESARCGGCVHLYML